MITIGKSYMIFKPKEKENSKGEKIVTFSIRNSAYDKLSNSWIQKGFINIIAKTNQFLSDRDKVTISKITAIDTSEYNDKQSVTAFVELEGEQQGNYEAVESSELPF